LREKIEFNEKKFNRIDVFKELEEEKQKTEWNKKTKFNSRNN